MRAHAHLPHGYRFRERIDLLRNRKHLRFVTWLSLVLAVVILLIGFLIQPPAQPFDWFTLFEQALIGICGIILYIAGHEAVHGALMWLVSRQKPRFGFHLMYAYAGSKAYFHKLAYLIIAIAPLTLWAIALNMLMMELPAVYFWPVWAVQVMNVSGSAGDLYMFALIVQKPSDILVQDDGTVVTVWQPV